MGADAEPDQAKLRRSLPRLGRLAPLIIWPVFALITLAPFCAVRVPGLGDTLNHLARMHVLVSLGQSQDLQRYYQIHWTPIPYLSMDAVVPFLARVVPLYLAGNLFVLACIVLPPAGTATLHYVLHRRLSLVPLAATLAATNTLLAFGFLNYLFALGFALFLLAAWIACAGWPRWRRAAVFAPAVLILYFGHAFACFAYCLAVCGVESGRALRARLSPLPKVAADCLAAFAQAIPALFFAATLDVRSGYVGALQTHYGDIASKALALVSPVLFLHDKMNGLVVLGTVALVALLLARLRLSQVLWPACLPVALASVAMPHVVASTWGMDLRLPLFLVLLLIAGASFPDATRWRAVVAVMVAGLLLTAKSVDSWGELHRLDGEIAETRKVLANLPRGARLLAVNATGHSTGAETIPSSSFWNMPLTAVIDRDAYVPYLFNGLTTVRMRPELRLSSTPNGRPITPAQLLAGMNATVPPGVDPGDGEGARLYWLGWPKNFDFVLVQRFGAEPGALPAVLRPVAHAPDMDLYRISQD
jgi:hypothetical protein